jgi:signal transduction histidine kinase
MSPGVPFSELLLASAVVFLGLALATALAWRELHGIPGLGRLALAYALWVTALGLYAGAGQLGGTVLPNLALISGAALLYDGIRVLYGRVSARRPLLVVAILSLGAVPGLTWVWPDTVARAVLVTGLVALLLGSAAAVSWRARRPGDLLDLATSLSLATCAGVIAARVGLALIGGHAGLTGRDGITKAAILIGTLAAVVCTLAILSSANRRLALELGAQSELFANLLTVARGAGEGPGLDAALEGTLRLARAATGATGSSFMLLDESGGFTRGIYTRGESARSFEPAEAEPLLREGLSGWVAREKRSAIVPDVERDPRWCPLPAPDIAVRSTLAVPIATGTALVGILTLDHPEPDRFAETHRRLMESAAAQIALVLRNVQIADARLRAARRERLLNAVLRVSARRLEADAIARAAVEAISLETGWHSVWVAIPDEEGRFRLLGTTGVSEQALGQGVIGRAYAKGETQVVADVSRDPDYVPGARRGHSELAVPMRQGGRTFGVLDVESPRLAAFGRDEIALCESLAEAIGLGLENARLSREREELVNTMVHDLRSPMVSIMGSLQFLARAEGLEPGERRLLEMAERNAQRLASLVTAILDVSRLEQGAMRLQLTRFALAPLVAEVLRLAAPRAEARRLELTSSVPDDLPELEADRGLVLRVLENLVGNAIKFSPEAGGPVRVAAQRETGRVTVSVSDSGPGVDEAARRRLFQKFAPGDHEARGSGLGLAFCRLAVEANGGRLWLDQAEAAGARFVFSLPA